MKRLCTICARGGSLGVKNKNVMLLRGKPLIAHSILQAKASGLFDVIAVSSDSVEILEAAKIWGANFLIERPAELATSTAAKLPAIQHAVLATEKQYDTAFSVIVDLDATSPLRTVADIQNAVTLLDAEQASNVITAAPARRSPYFNLVEVRASGQVELSKKLSNPIVRRQDAPLCYDMNASIYVWRRDYLLNSATLFGDDTRLYVMPEERSIDIDSPLDFQFVELLANQREELL